MIDGIGFNPQNLGFQTSYQSISLKCVQILWMLRNKDLLSNLMFNREIMNYLESFLFLIGWIKITTVKDALKHNQKEEIISEKGVMDLLCIQIEKEMKEVNSKEFS